MKHHYFVDTKLIGYYLHQRGGSVHGMFDKIASFIYRMPKGQVHLAFDVGASTFRKEISPTYKGHRKKANDRMSDEDKAALKKFNQDYISMIDVSKMLNTRVLAVPGVEADDLISIQVEKLLKQAKEVDEEVMIYMITSDMDYKNSVIGRDNVAIINVFQEGSIIDNDVIKQQDNLKTRRMFNIHKSIFGDLSDNIKFMRNLGPVKCQEVFDRIYEYYEDPSDEDVIAELVRYAQDKPRLTVHEHHVEVGRETIMQAFLANMRLVDTFLDTSKMTEEQEVEYQACIDRPTSPSITTQELMQKTIEIFEVPIILGFKASKVFGVKD